MGSVLVKDMQTPHPTKRVVSIFWSNFPIFFRVMADCIYNFTVTHWAFQVCYRPTSVLQTQKNRSKVVKFTVKMRIVLKRMKNKFSDI